MIKPVIFDAINDGYLNCEKYSILAISYKKPTSVHVQHPDLQFLLSLKRSNSGFHIPVLKNFCNKFTNLTH